ncbi:MAG: hypothetical protein RLP15_00465 [Cryomorphaceae bacterium]
MIFSSLCPFSFSAVELLQKDDFQATKGDYCLRTYLWQRLYAYETSCIPSSVFRRHRHPQCNPCKCTAIEDIYFDINDLEVGHTSTSGNYLDLEQPIQRDAYAGIGLSFETDYIVQSHLSASFANAAYACSCLEPGWAGSKHEAFESITITSTEAIGDQISAGDTVTQLFAIRWDLDTMDIAQFIALDTGNIAYEYYNLILKEFPSGEVESFEFDVRVALSTGEVYTDRTAKIFFQP